MSNALQKLAKKTKGKSKSKTPVVEQESLAPAVQAWLDAKERAEAAKADMDAAEQEFLPFAEDARIAACQEANDRVTSVRISTSEGRVLVVSSERFSDVNDEALPGLKKTFGTKSGRFFQTRMVAKVKDNLPDETVNAMVQALTDAGLDVGDLLDVESKTVVTPAFLSESVIDPKLAAKRKQAIEEGDLRPYKAKVRK